MHSENNHTQYGTFDDNSVIYHHKRTISPYIFSIISIILVFFVWLFSGHSVRWRQSVVSVPSTYFFCPIMSITHNFHLPVIVHSSRRQSSRLLIMVSVLWSSIGASKNGNMTAPNNVYDITSTQRPGVENIIRNVKCTKFDWMPLAVSLSSSAISPSLFSGCDIVLLRLQPQYVCPFF